MRNHIRLAALGLLISALLTVFLLFSKRYDRRIIKNPTAAVSVNATPAVPQLVRDIQRPGGAFVPDDPRWKEWNAKEKVDPSFQWKMPIEFYGKVVDQNGRAVSGAKLEITGTDASATGNFRRTLTSDEGGSVSLTGLQGKGFDVFLSKPGYDVPADNRRTFEYAAFWDPFFYQPNAAFPVIFRLRKKAVAEPLVYRTGDIHFDKGGNAEFAVNEQTRLRVKLLQNDPPREHKWSVRLEILNGGMRPTAEEFPVEAPSDGYQSTITIDTYSPKPAGWQQIYEGALLFTKSGMNYGRVDVKMIPGKQWMRVDSWINPREGSRNLEQDPSQTVLSTTR